MRPPLLPFDDHTSNDGGRHQAPRPSMLGIRQSRRARRRSSARFLQLSKSNHNASSTRNSISYSCAEDEITEPETQTNDNLQELYKKAIRMNAENKINASNSWSLRLIENMDTLLEEEETTESAVNFTKASCTLDASVKIYSYRVDDVHLTSYKVLANLHRNSNKKTTDADADEEGTTDQPATGSNKRRENARGAATGSTLESNVCTLHFVRVSVSVSIAAL